MDSNTAQMAMDDRQSQLNKNILILKIPANVKNVDKCIEMMGGKEKIITKYSNDEDIDLNLFMKKIPLEKCVTNDLVIRRKRYRNKNK